MSENFERSSGPSPSPLHSSDPDLTTTTGDDLAREALSGREAGGGGVRGDWVLKGWNEAVPTRMRARAAPRVVPSAPDGYDWRAVFRMVARNAFLCGDQRRNGPVTLAWVVTHADEVLEHATEEAPEVETPRRVVRPETPAAPTTRDAPPVALESPARAEIARLLGLHQELPMQTCPRCGARYRHRHGGECHECYARRVGLTPPEAP